MENTQTDNPSSPTPDSGQVVLPTEATPTVVAPAQPQDSAVKSGNSFKKLLPLIVIGILTLIVGAVGYYLFVFESPAKIASRAEDVNGAFVKYSRVVRRVSQHLEKDSGSSADEMERYASQGEDLMKEARDARSDLDKELRETKVSKLNNYLQNLNDYIKKADELTEIEGENINMSKASVKPFRMYEDLTIELSGASNYLISDTKKYAEIMVNGIAEEKEIMELFQEIEVEDPFDEYHKYTISGMGIEIKYLESLLAAVENRDSSAIATASKVFAQDMQKNGSDASRISDKINSDIKELGQKLEELREDVDAEYINLKNEYKF